MNPKRQKYAYENQHVEPPPAATAQHTPGSFWERYSGDPNVQIAHQDTTTIVPAKLAYHAPALVEALERIDRCAKDCGAAADAGNTQLASELADDIREAVRQALIDAQGGSR